MAARATSSGTISFGLVSIPVKLYAASRSKALRFNMLHDEDHARLKQQLVCTACGEPVDRADTVKGYEYARGQYVVLSDEEIESVEKKSDRSIEIEEFVPIEQVDPAYFDRANLLGPDKGGQKAYVLLRDAMERAGKVAIGRYSTRGRQQLVLLRATEGGLMMHTLLYADEVRDFEDVETGEESVELKKGELDLAEQLIAQLSSDRFEPSRYEDEYRQALLEIVDRKVAGEEVVVTPPADEREKIIDLMSALKKSIDEGASERIAEAKKPARAKSKKAAGRKKKSA